MRFYAEVEWCAIQNIYHGGGNLSHYLEATWEIAISTDSRKGVR
jgi:hypothetical protein